MTWRCDFAAISLQKDKTMCRWWRPEFAVQHHVEEEELILWSKTSLKAPLISQGYKRYKELFERYVGSEAKDIAA